MVTLTDDDRELLEALRDGGRGVDDVAEAVEKDPDDVEERFEELHDNGLVHDKADGWTLTRDGHHLLEAPGDGSADDRIDTTERVEATIESFQIRPDRADAVRAAFAYLRSWGEATAAEIAADVYDEHPAGYPGPDEWWDQFVEEYLAELPGVERPDDGETWRYEETAGDGGSAPGEAPASTEAGRPDGREIDLEEPTDPRGGLKHALETLDATEAEREAVVAAASLLRERGESTGNELAAAVYARYDAGYDAPEALWERCLRPTFESLPEIERRTETRWRHAGTTADEGSATVEDRSATADDRSASTDDGSPAADDSVEPTTGDGENAEGRGTDVATIRDAEVCPVCGESSAGLSIHLAGETIVPARRYRSCVRATPTDDAVAITIYYHRDGRA